MSFYLWVVEPWHLLWRVPLLIVGALLTWAIWWWVWDVVKPWVTLALSVLGHLFDRLGKLMDWFPPHSKLAAERVAHLLKVCEGKYTCKWCIEANNK